MTTTPTVTESGEEHFDYGGGLIAYPPMGDGDFPQVSASRS